MNKHSILAAALACLAIQAHASPELAKSKNCITCHTPDKKLVGPAYKDIGAKYAGDAGAEARLAQKIQKGSTGVWGPIPMPPNAQVNDADAKALAKWILAQK